MWSSFSFASDLKKHQKDVHTNIEERISNEKTEDASANKTNLKHIRKILNKRLKQVHFKSGETKLNSNRSLRNGVYVCQNEYLHLVEYEYESNILLKYST